MANMLAGRYGIESAQVRRPLSLRFAPRMERAGTKILSPY
jgi:hypothetical protein